jgi:hypothetical protein
MLGVFLSLFKTVGLSARHFRHRRRRSHSCSPQQPQIRTDVWYSSRTKFSPKLKGPTETPKVCSFRRRSRQSFTKPLSSCIRRVTSSQSRFILRSGSRFVKRTAKSISAPRFSTSTLTTPRGFVLLIDRRVGVALFAVGGVPPIVAPGISRKLANKSCEISSRRKHGH